MVNGGGKMADGNAPKRVFLRKVLYRIDFQFITEQMQEEIYSFIAEKYGDFFSDRGYEQGNAVDIEINTNVSDVPKFNSRPQTVYYLIKPKDETGDGRTIKIGKTFIFLDIDLAIDSEKILYYKWFADIINYLNEKRLFKPMRIGLRKFNTFFILHKNIGKVNNIFSISYFDNIENTEFDLDHFNNLQVYTVEGYSLNFLRGFSTGFLNNVSMDINNELAHQISFDFDLYSDNTDVLNDFCENTINGLEIMNDKIYSFFKTVISEDVCRKIGTGDLLSDYGVLLF